MVLWGRTSPCLNSNCSARVPNNGDGPDGRGGEQPVGTVVRNNVVREVGVWERQGTMFNQALSPGTVLEGNIFYNCDRAAVNYNDGMGGGRKMLGNLLFNTGRGGNKDEGSINTWDRAPYITTLRNGTPSTIPATNEISGNFLLANYNPTLAVDTDDGSSFYNTSGNFVVYGQQSCKADFNAHDIHTVGNYFAYVDSSWSGWATGGGFVNNSVVFRGAGNGHYLSDCGLVNNPALGQIGGNTLHAFDSSTMRVPCINKTVPGSGCVASCLLKEWLQQGHDVGTTLAPLPTDREVIRAARALLSMGMLE